MNATHYDPLIKHKSGLGAETEIPQLDLFGWQGGDGGEYRIRTGVHGFAIRCVATPPTRRLARTFRVGEGLGQGVFFGGGGRERRGGGSSLSLPLSLSPVLQGLRGGGHFTAG